MKISSAEFQVASQKHSDMLEITAQVARAVQDAQAQHGVVHVFVAHTTAGVTINENADPDVVHDLLQRFTTLAPHKANDKHAEGNSDAHLKTSLVGSSLSVFISDGELQLGQWQGIYLCEFDGPRRRTVWLKIIAE